MKIESVRIENFRSFKDETIRFDDYTCLVGPNGGGKSTILEALNIFFRDVENASTDITKLYREDFHHKDISKQIKITLTFVDLNQAAQEDFKNYFRQGKLIVSAIAEFDEASGRAEVNQYGQRLVMSEFKEFFKVSSVGGLVKGLKEIYVELKKSFPDLSSATTKDAMSESLRSYEESHPEDCGLIQSRDQFYGISGGVNILAKYIQWVFIPAAKDITLEQNEGKGTVLGKILERTVRQGVNFEEPLHNLQEETITGYNQILEENQGVLKTLQEQLNEQLKVWAHPDASVTLSWKGDTGKLPVQIEKPTVHTKAGEGEFEGDLSRLGHGFQRSYLLAVLQVLAKSDQREDAPTLLLACEEPELYQHPPQARHLSSVLQELSLQGTQVFVTTHNPAFATGQGFESIRLVRFNPALKTSQQKQLTFKEVAERIGEVSGTEPVKSSGILAKLHQELQPALSEMFFTRNLVLVEGLEDLAIITSWMILTDRWSEFRRRGVHIVPVGGKSHLIYPLVIAQGMKMPVFTVFDADGNAKKELLKEHEKDNKTLLRLLELDESIPFPKTTLWGERFVVWPTEITDVIETEIPEDKLRIYQERADVVYGHVGGLKKNSLHISLKLKQAFEDGIKLPSLEKLCAGILAMTEN
ncbi:AAA family ATPase [Patescibacteria group bacterium]|nr:AAA family ATPase [Patescibacteria group bacterium]